MGDEVMLQEDPDGSVTSTDANGVTTYMVQYNLSDSNSKSSIVYAIRTGEQMSTANYGNYRKDIMHIKYKDGSSKTFFSDGFADTDNSGRYIPGKQINGTEVHQFETQKSMQVAELLTSYWSVNDYGLLKLVINENEEYKYHYKLANIVSNIAVKYIQQLLNK